MEQPKYLTPQEVAARYGDRVTVRTLANWRCAGTSPPYTKVGGRVLYPLAHLVQWERNRTFDYTGAYHS